LTSFGTRSALSAGSAISFPDLWRLRFCGMWGIKLLVAVEIEKVAADSDSLR
jgi:hypothetical protein